MRSNSTVARLRLEEDGSHADGNTSDGGADGEGRARADGDGSAVATTDRVSSINLCVRRRRVTHPMAEVALSHPFLTPEVTSPKTLAAPEVAVFQAMAPPEVAVFQAPAPPEVNLSAPSLTPEAAVFQAPSAPLPILEPTDWAPFWLLLSTRGQRRFR